MHCHLFSRVCVINLTFCANCIPDSYSAIQTVYLDQPTNQQFTPLKSSTVFSHCDTCHWHLETVEHICWRVVSSCSQLNAGLLWCWRLTRPPLCRICFGVDRSGATDIKGNMYVVSVGEHDSSSTGSGTDTQGNWGNQGYPSEPTSVTTPPTSLSTPPKSPVNLPLMKLQASAISHIPISGNKCQLVI